ncbi:NAD(P)/FAD-dependent oxidoreductase [Dehalococcoidia bacterium]|nr:NAD(P)/FAD-dependent oxidoreductase [Dehalococcoidia bacterium]
MDYYDVLIIGGGPAGSRVSFNLAKLGYKVAVLEKHEGIGDHVCCTGIISRKCVDLFNVANDCILQESKSAKVFAPSGEFLMISKDEVQAYILDRVALDLSLAEKAERQGAGYFLSTCAKDIAIRDDGVEVRADQRGKVLTFRGKAVIIANGFASRLPQQLGLGAIKDFIGGVQTEVEIHGITEVEVHFSQRIARGFFAWLVPLSQHRARAGLLSRDKPGNCLRDFLAQLATQGKISPTESRITYGGIPLRPLPRTYGERVLVVGDAAGHVKPTTGGGIYYGLLCADMAAEAIHEAFLLNDFSRRRLAAYERAWKGKLGRELQTGYFARRLYNRLSDRRINKMFDIVRENNIHEALIDSPHFSFDRHSGLVLEGLKHLAPWRHLFGKVIPARIPGAQHRREM